MSPESAVARWRAALRERHAWIVLLAVFAVCFVPGNGTAATNLYRLLVVVPMLLCCRPGDFADLWRQVPARWFLLLCAWLSLSLLWDGWSHKDVKLLLRALNVLALFYLVFLIGRFHRRRIALVLDGWVAFGLLGAVLIVWDWPQLWAQGPGHHIGSARGVFNHHVLVGWALAATALVALYRFVTAASRRALVVHGLAALGLGLLVLWVQARGAYVVLGSGVLLILLLHPGRRALAIAGIGMLLALTLLLLFPEQLALVGDQLLERGTAGRPEIWRQGWQRMAASGWRLWLGQGLSAAAAHEVAGTTAAHYHNLLLNQLFYAGVVGVLLYLGWLAALLRQALRDPGLRLWGVLVVAMQLGFITDGDRLFVNPSALLLAFLLPAFLLGFRVPAPGSAITPAPGRDPR